MPAAGLRRLISLALPPGEDFVSALEQAWAGGHAVLPIDPFAPAAATDRLVAAMRKVAGDHAQRRIGVMREHVVDAGDEPRVRVEPEQQLARRDEMGVGDVDELHRSGCTACAHCRNCARPRACLFSTPTRAMAPKSFILLACTF